MPDRECRIRLYSAKMVQIVPGILWEGLVRFYHSSQSGDVLGPEMVSSSLWLSFLTVSVLCQG